MTHLIHGKPFGSGLEVIIRIKHTSHTHTYRPLLHTNISQYIYMYYKYAHQRMYVAILENTSQQLNTKLGNKM